MKTRMLENRWYITKRKDNQRFSPVERPKMYVQVRFVKLVWKVCEISNSKF